MNSLSKRLHFTDWLFRAKHLLLNGHFVAIAGFAVFFVIIFRDVLFYPKLILVTDFTIPSTNPYYHVMYFITSWAPHNLGFASIPGWSGLLTGLFVFLSGGNQLIAQKLLLLHIPLAGVFMYAFIIKHITKSKTSAFTGAMLYAYSPIVLDNFATQILWGYALFPLVFHFAFNIIEGEPKLKDALVLAIATVIASSMSPHLLGILPPALAFFFLVFFLKKRNRSYLVKVFKYALIAVSLYFILSVQSYVLFILSGSGNTLSFVSPLQEQFYSNYEGLLPFNLIKLTGIGHPLLHTIHYLYLQSNYFGFILPILAFSALFTAMRFRYKEGKIALILNTRRKQYVYAMSFSLLIILTILFVESIRNRTLFFEWIYAAYPPIITLRNPFAVMMLIAFAYGVLISITSNSIRRRLLKSLKKKVFFVKRPSLLGVFIAVVILCAYFLYVPAYDSALQKATPYIDNPSVYGEIVDWLRAQGEDGSFRYLLVPQSHVSQLNLPTSYPYQFLAVSGASYPNTQNYVLSTYDTLVNNKTSSFEALLAYGNVKYVILVSDTTEIEHIAWMQEGEVSISGDNLIGDYAEFVEAMTYQNNISLIEQQSGYLIYEVEDFISYVTLFQNAIYVIGGIEDIEPILNLPGFSVKNNLLIFGGNESLVYDSIPTYVSTILVYDSNNTELRDFSEEVLANKSIIILYNEEDFAENTILLDTDLMSFASVDGLSILAGEGDISIDTTVKPEDAENSISYKGSSATDKLFSIVYSFPNVTALDEFDEIRYFFRVSDTSTSGNVEFALIDDSLANARRWYTDILPSASPDTWQEVRINLTAYSYEDSDFNISRVKLLQFTTYTSEPTSQVEMWVGPVVGTTINTKEVEFSAEIPTSSNYSLCFMSSMPSSSVTIGGIITSITDRGNGWYETDPVFLSSGTANVSITIPIDGKVEAATLVNEAKLENVFSEYDSSFSYSIRKLSATKYEVKLETEEPVFLVLGESYHQDWRARIEGKELSHFVASSWCNGYCVDSVGNLTIVIEFEQQTTHIVLSVFVLSVFSLSLIFVSCNALRHYRKTKEGRDIGCSNSTFKTAD